MTSAASFRQLSFLLPMSMFMSACVVDCRDGEDDYDCDDEKCCDEYGCYPHDDGGPGPGGFSTSGGYSSTGGSGQGGAAQGGAGGEGGAAPSCDSTTIVCACSASSECADGLACLDGQCLPACTFDYECGDASVCADGRCVAECSSELPCEAGYACVGGGCLPDPANPQCTDASSCGTESCVDGFCAPLCASNADCPTGTLCDATTASCFPDPSPTPVCDAVTSCPNEAQQCGDDGYCHYECSTLQDCLLIDSRFDACDIGVCKTDEELSPACSYDLPCADGSPCVSNECVGMQ